MKAIVSLALLSLVFFSVYSQPADCNSVIVANNNGAIKVSGISAAEIVGVQVFNASWSSVFNQSYITHGDNIATPVLPPGQYLVNVRFYTNNWTSICEKSSNVTISEPIPPQTENCDPTFMIAYGGDGDEYANDVVRTDDGYVMTGKASVIIGDSYFNGILMKVNKKGIPVWTKHYGAGAEDFFNTLIVTSDGGFLAGGRTKSFGNATGDPWLVKTDASGNVLWQKRYTNNSSPGIIYGIIQTSDGGYAVSGYYYPSLGGSGNADWMVIKIDGNGNIQWRKRIGTSVSEEAVKLIEDDHGGAGLVVTGYSSGLYDLEANIIKLDLSNGNTLWTRSYDFDMKANRLGTIFKVSDGFIISAANQDNSGSNAVIHMILKTDFDGNIIMRKEFQAPGCVNGQMVILPDGGFMIAMSETPLAYNTDIHLMRVDPSWNIVWTKRYPMESNQRVNALIVDGDFVVGVGYAASGQNNNIILFRCDSSGNIGTCSPITETGISKTPRISNMPEPWTITGDWNLVSNNTNFYPVAVSLGAKVMCIDSCAIPKVVSISSVTVDENTQSESAIMRVCLSAPYADTLFFEYSTSDGTAVSNSDFYPGKWKSAFLPGQTCINIGVTIKNDTISEQTETFTVSIGQVSATVTINDDDKPHYDCNNVVSTAGNNQIRIRGIIAPVATVQIFNNSWASVFNQTYTNSPDTVNIPIPQGTYHVKVTFYTSNWSLICDKNQDLTVINQCPAGTICISNVCPTQNVNLDSIYSFPNLPAGTTVSWHTGTPATDANKLTPAQAQNLTTSGTYYGAINISGANCYSSTIPVSVTISACNTSSANGSMQVRSTDVSEGDRISAFPNPFTHSVKVIIPATKSERAAVDVLDMMGRSIQVKAVQLVRGSNQVILDGLDKYPSGSYFIRVKLATGVETLKVLRQQ